MSLDTRLKQNHRRVASASRRLEEAKEGFLDVILEAVREGYSLQAIADVLGLSKSRAQQLVRQADGRGRSSR